MRGGGGDRGGGDRSYGIWWFIALFVVLLTMGIIVLVGGAPSTPTELVEVGQTPNTALTAPTLAPLPENAPDPSTTSPADPSVPADPDPSAPVTVPGGAPAPEGVREVLRSGDATSYTFDVPEQLVVAGAEPVVLPTRAVPEGDASLRLTLSCARTTAEVLAQVSIDETGEQVSVLAVALAPTGGPPCDPGTPPVELVLPLSRPLDGRAVSVVPPGGVPLPALGP